MFYKKPGFYSIIIASVYGLLDELHQYFIPGRFCDILDWTANFLGVLTGVVIVFFFIIKKNYSVAE